MSFVNRPPTEGTYESVNSIGNQRFLEFKGDVAKTGYLDRPTSPSFMWRGTVIDMFSVRQRRRWRFVPFGAVTEEHFFRQNCFQHQCAGTLFTVQKRPWALPATEDGLNHSQNGSVASAKGYSLPPSGVYCGE